MSAIVIDVETRANLRPLGDGLSAATAKATEFEKSINAANARVLAFGASAGLIYKMGEAFNSLIQSTISVEKSLTEVNTLLDKSQSDLASFGAELFSVAKQSAQSFEVVAEAAKELARQGLNSEQVIERTSEAMNLMRLSGLQASSSVETLTAVLNTFSEANLTATSAVEKMAAIDAKFAVSSSQLAEGLKRSSAAAVDAGVSYEELLGVITVVQERTARGGAVIGNALKSIFTRLQRTEVLDDLRNLGIQVENTQGEILPMIEILKNLSVSYQSLGPASKAFIGEQVAGVYQIGTLKALMADLSKENSRFSETQAVAANSSGSTAKRVEQLNTTLDAYIVRLNESAKAFGAAFGGIGLSSGLKDLAGAATSILESLTPDPKNSEEMGHKIGVGIMKGLGSFLTGPGLLGAAFIGGKILIKFFTDAAQAAHSLASIGNVINKELADRQSLESAIALHLAKQPAVMEQIKNGTFNIANAQNAILNQLREEERLRISIRNISNQMAGPLSQANIRAHSGAGNPPSGMYSKTSRGFIPNFAFDEVQNAIRLGASKSVQAVPGKGNIGGKPFLANNQELQKPNFLGSGETAVIPLYGGGMQKAAEMIAKGQSGPILGARGFVPNFTSLPVLSGRNAGGAKPISLEVAKKLEKNIIDINPASGTLRHPFGVDILDLQKLSTSDAYSIIDAARKKYGPAAQVSVMPGIENPLASALKSNSLLKHKFSDLENLFPHQIAATKFAGFIPNFATKIENAAIRTKNTLTEILESDYKLKGKLNRDMTIPSSPRTVGSLIGGVGGSAKAYKGLDKDKNFYNKVKEIIHDTDVIHSPIIEIIDLREIKGKGGKQIKALLKKKEKAEQAAQKAIRGIEGKIAQLEASPTSRVAKDASGVPIRHGGNSALDIIGRNILGENILGEVRSGNFNLSHIPIIQEKFQRFAVQNPNSPRLNPPGFTVDRDNVTYKEGKYRLYVGGIEAASGFIPNFSKYMAGVSGLEEKLSGEKATFHKKPFPHFRNESQPTFASAMNDHGGLSSALKDSIAGQKAAGLISNGYVPNFARKPYSYSGKGQVIDPRSSISKASNLSLADQERQARDEFNKIINSLRTGAMNAEKAKAAFETLKTQAGLSAESTRNLNAALNRQVRAASGSGPGFMTRINTGMDRMFGTGMDKTMKLGMASAALGMAGGAVSEIAGADSTAGRAVSGLANVASYGAMGAAFGGVGLPVGLAIGTVIEGYKFFSKSQEENAKKLQEKLQSSNEAFNSTIKNIDLLKSSIERLANASTETEKKLIEKEQREYMFNIRSNIDQLERGKFLSKEEAKTAREYLDKEGDVKALENFEPLRVAGIRSGAQERFAAAMSNTDKQKGLTDVRQAFSQIFQTLSEDEKKALKRGAEEFEFVMSRLPRGLPSANSKAALTGSVFGNDLVQGLEDNFAKNFGTKFSDVVGRFGSEFKIMDIIKQTNAAAKNTQTNIERTNERVKEINQGLEDFKERIFQASLKFSEQLTDLEIKNLNKSLDREFENNLDNVNVSLSGFAKSTREADRKIQSIQDNLEKSLFELDVKKQENLNSIVAKYYDQIASVAKEGKFNKEAFEEFEKGIGKFKNTRNINAFDDFLTALVNKGVSENMRAAAREMIAALRRGTAQSDQDVKNKTKLSEQAQKAELERVNNAYLVASETMRGSLIISEINRKYEKLSEAVEKTILQQNLQADYLLEKNRMRREISDERESDRMSALGISFSSSFTAYQRRIRAFEDKVETAQNDLSKAQNTQQAKTDLVKRLAKENNYPEEIKNFETDAEDEREEENKKTKNVLQENLNKAKAALIEFDRERLLVKGSPEYEQLTAERLPFEQKIGQSKQELADFEKKETEREKLKKERKQAITESLNFLNELKTEKLSQDEISKGVDKLKAIKELASGELKTQMENLIKAIEGQIASANSVDQKQALLGDASRNLADAQTSLIEEFEKTREEEKKNLTTSLGLKLKKEQQILKSQLDIDKKYAVFSGLSGGKSFDQQSSLIKESELKLAESRIQSAIDQEAFQEQIAELTKKREDFDKSKREELETLEAMGEERNYDQNIKFNKLTAERLAITEKINDLEKSIQDSKQRQRNAELGIERSLAQRLAAAPEMRAAEMKNELFKLRLDAEAEKKISSENLRLDRLSQTDVRAAFAFGGQDTPLRLNRDKQLLQAQVNLEKDTEEKERVIENLENELLTTSAKEKRLRIIEDIKAVNKEITHEGEKYGIEVAKINDLYQIQLKNLKETRSIGYITSNFFKDLAEASDPISNLQRDMKQLVGTMQKGFEDAFVSFVEGSASAGNAFKAFARGVAQEIVRMSARFTANLLMNNLLNVGSAIGSALLPESLTSLFRKNTQNKAMGGIITGGSGIKDDVPALLTGGEYVLRKSAVSKYGVDFLNQINAQKFNTGGMVLDNRYTLGKFSGDFLKGSSSILAGAPEPPTPFGPSENFTKGGEFTMGQYNIDPRLSNIALSDENNPQNRIREEMMELDLQRQTAFETYSVNKKYQLVLFKKQLDDMAKGAQINAAIQVGMMGLSAAATAGSNTAASQSTPATSGGGGNPPSVTGGGPTFVGAPGPPSFQGTGQVNPNAPVNQGFFSKIPVIGPFLGKIGSGLKKGFVNAFADEKLLQNVKSAQEVGATYNNPGFFKFFLKNLLGTDPGQKFTIDGRDFNPEEFSNLVSQAKSLADQNKLNAIASARRLIYEQPPNFVSEFSSLSLYPRNDMSRLYTGMRTEPTPLDEQLSFTSLAGRSLSPTVFEGKKKFGDEGEMIRRLIREQEELKKIFPMFFRTTRASGGSIPGSADNIPALLMGGEYVINKSAVDKYGAGFMDKLNRGQVKGFAAGGMVGELPALGSSTRPENNEGVSSILTAALEKLAAAIENKSTDKVKSDSGTTNNVEIVINVADHGKSSGTSKSSSESEEKEDEDKSETENDKNNEKYKELGNLIKTVVIDTISKEQRPGGLLEKSKR